jgi:hypothetical protein
MQPPVDMSCATYRYVTAPSNLYVPQWLQQPVVLPSNQLDRCTLDKQVKDEEEASLCGQIVSPPHPVRRRQALADHISPLDVARLANAWYHGGVHGYFTVRMGTVQHCGCTAINLSDVILSYNDIIHLHQVIWYGWEHPHGR